MAMNLPVLKADYKEGQLFRHMDGGFYQYEKSVYFADDQDELVIYKHIWPFDSSEWARRLSEFESRFTPVTFEELYKAQLMGREALQAEIEQTRTNRRNAKK